MQHTDIFLLNSIIWIQIIKKLKPNNKPCFHGLLFGFWGKPNLMETLVNKGIERCEQGLKIWSDNITVSLLLPVMAEALTSPSFFQKDLM